MNLPVPPRPERRAEISGEVLRSKTAVRKLDVGFSPEQKLEFLEYWRSVVKRRWSIIALVAAAALLAGTIAFVLPPVYEGAATVLIEMGKPKILSIEQLYADNQQRDYFQTQVEIIKSREVAERTARALKLWEIPEFDPRITDKGLWPKIFSIISKKEKNVWTEETLLAASVKRLMMNTTVVPVKLSQLITVETQAGNPILAAKLANTLAKQYMESDRDERSALAQQVSQQLQDRMVELRTKLSMSERALQEYREKRGILNLSGSAQTAAGQQMEGMNDRLMEAKNQRISRQSVYAAAKAAKGDFGAVPAVMKDLTVVDAQKAVTLAKARLAELQKSLGEKNERVIQAQGEVDDLTATLKRQQSLVVAGLKQEYDSSVEAERSLESALSSAHSSVRDLNREEFQLGVLEREYESNRQLYEMFMSRAKETNVTGDVQSSVARVVDSALPPESPLKPKKTQIVAASAGLALFIGTLGALLLHRFDDTIKGGNDAESRLNEPVLASLPRVTFDPGQRPMSRVFLDLNHSQFSEGIRTARTGILLSNLDVENKIILVTSSVPGEGKTTVSANLALAHAQTKSTLLIDCDMRRAQVARSLGVPIGAKGLTNFVSGNSSIERCVSPVEGSSLFVMPVGDLPPKPLELLLSKRFKDALAELSNRFEIIIIDSPPVELVSDALVLAPLVTAVAVVVKAMSTPAPLIRKSLSRLQRAGGTVLGILVNQLDFADAQRYYGEYGVSSYSYELTDDNLTAARKISRNSLA